MKKFTNSIFILFFFCITGFAQVQVGTGTNESQALPLEPYYGYSYSQSIYLQSEINSAGMITGIQYFYSGITLMPNSDDNIDIYMAHSTKTSFSGTTDWEAAASLTLVFSGSLPAPTTAGVDEWISIPLDNPFAYNNTDNLIIAVDANEAGYDSSSDDFHCSSVTGTRSIYYRSDSTNPDPTSPPTGVTLSYIPNVILEGLAAPLNCAGSPTFPGDAASISNSCGGDVTLEWPTPTGQTPDNYDVFFGTTSGSLSLETNTPGNTFVKAGLTDNTTYYWMVVPKVGATAATGCAEWSFTTTSSADSGTGDATYDFMNSKAAGGPAYNWIDPVAGGHTEITSMTSGTDDDGYFHVTNMGITFNFNGGLGYTECYIGTNGYVSFENGYTSTGGSTTIPSTSDPDNMIAVAMMDLDDRNDGQIFYAQVGNDFVITWLKYHDYFDDTEWMSFQAILQGDADGGFILNYNQAESSASIPDFLIDAVIGIEIGDTEGAVYRTNGSLGPIFCSPLAVEFGHSVPLVVLPIEMTLFEGVAMAKTNMLKWETASEKNTKVHIVERSIDGRNNWTEIASVTAAGWSSQLQRYELEDKAPLALGYYRVVSIDFDGSENVSDIVLIEREANGFGVVSVFPIPTENRLTVQFAADQNEEMTITMTNLVGQVISQERYLAIKGLNTKEMNLSRLADGVYFITISNGVEKVTKRIIKD